MQTKQLIVGVLTLGLLGFGLSGCSSDEGSTGGGSSSNTLSISGTLSTGLSSSSLGVQSYVGPNSVTAQATACSDGNYYQIYCVTFEETPTAATGSVACSGTSGSYTVDGLPKNTPFGCFVRASTDNSSYSTVGTIELPSTGALGETDSIVAEGDMGVNVSIGSDGKVSAEVTSDGRSDTSTTGLTNATEFNGIYSMTCPAPSDTTVYSQAACKCFLTNDYSGTSYNGANDPEQACLNDNASELSNVQMFVDVNLYDAQATQNITDENNNVVIRSGDKVQAVTVWGAMNSTTSARSGGEGLSDFASSMGLSFLDTHGFKSQAETAISWATAIDTDNAGGAGTTIPTMPATSTSTKLSNWIGWLQGAVQSAVANESWDCTSDLQGGANTDNTVASGSGDPENDAACLQEFAEDHLKDVTLPRVHVEYYCDYNGCKEDPNLARFWIDGVEFEYGEWTSTQDPTAIAVSAGSGGPSPDMRFVFEQWMPFPNGGGGFKQYHDEHRGYDCIQSGTPQDWEVVNSDCNANGADRLECFAGEELAIRFLPTSTSGTYKGIFENRTVVYGGQWHLQSNTSGPVQNTAARTKCEEKLKGSRSDDPFLTTVVKQ